jgi:hypothetical protein
LVESFALCPAANLSGAVLPTLTAFEALINSDLSFVPHFIIIYSWLLYYETAWMIMTHSPPMD